LPCIVVEVDNQPEEGANGVDYGEDYFYAVAVKRKGVVRK
jgi:hypothetical protein